MKRTHVNHYELFCLKSNIVNILCETQNLHTSITNLNNNYNLNKDDEQKMQQEITQFFCLPYRLYSKYKKYITSMCNIKYPKDYPKDNNVLKYKEETFNIENIKKIDACKDKLFYDFHSSKEYISIFFDDMKKEFDNDFLKMLNNIDFRNSHEHSYVYVQINKIIKTHCHKRTFSIETDKTQSPTLCEIKDIYVMMENMFFINEKFENLIKKIEEIEHVIVPCRQLFLNENDDVNVVESYAHIVTKKDTCVDAIIVQKIFNIHPKKTQKMGIMATIILLFLMMVIQIVSKIMMLFLK
jgi:hypothetical protein